MGLASIGALDRSLNLAFLGGEYGLNKVSSVVRKFGRPLLAHVPALDCGHLNPPAVCQNERHIWCRLSVPWDVLKWNEVLVEPIHH